MCGGWERMTTLTSETRVEAWKQRLHIPAYRVTEAARYSQTTPQTVAYWHYKGGALGPALPGKERGKPLSYVELVEVALVATFRRLGISLQRIRRARDYAAKTLDSVYPFAEFEFQTDGHRLFLEMQGVEMPEIERIIVADAGGQLGWRPLVAGRFAEFDYEDQLAVQWHVAGRQSPVVIDPRVAFGGPAVQGIPTESLKGRWNAGESLADLQEDFGLSRTDVISGLEFEGIEVVA